MTVAMNKMSRGGGLGAMFCGGTPAPAAAAGPTAGAFEPPRPPPPPPGARGPSAMRPPGMAAPAAPNFAAPEKEKEKDTSAEKEQREREQREREQRDRDVSDSLKAIMHQMKTLGDQNEVFARQLAETRELAEMRTRRSPRSPRMRPASASSTPSPRVVSLGRRTARGTAKRKAADVLSLDD